MKGTTGEQREVANLRSVRAAAATSSDAELGGPASQVDTVSGRRVQMGRQTLVALRLVFSDIVLACLIWYVASILQGAWGRAELSDIAIVGNVANVLVW